MSRDLGYSWKYSSWSSKQSCMKNWPKLCGGTNRYMTLSMSTRISSCRRLSGGALAVRACVLQEALMILQEEANLVRMQISWPKTKLMAITPNPTSHLPLKICNTEVLFVDSFTYLGSLMARPLVTLHLALPRLPLPCIAYKIHCFANTASAYKLRSTCIVPWLSSFRSMALKHGPPPSPIAGA